MFLPEDEIFTEIMLIFLQIYYITLEIIRFC